MNKSYNAMAVLKRDWMGSPYADFEKALLFDEDKEHLGWFKWVDGGGNRLFTLSKSPHIGVLPLDTPYYGKLPITTYYIFEDGYTGPYPSENTFIQVEVKGLPHTEIHPIRFRSFIVKDIIPIKDEELFNILPHPRLTLDDFRYYSTINFENAKNDNLDLLLPLQIVSAPKNEVGDGGIIAMKTSFLQDDLKKVKSFNKGILSQIPNVFKKENPVYIYKAISKKDEENGVARLYEKCNEVNLFLERNTTLDINIPVIQYESFYRQKLGQTLTSDIVSYQLSALICQPHIDDKDIKDIENSIVKARTRIENNAIAFNMKPNSALKVAEANARMAFVQNNYVSKFVKNAEHLLDNQVKSQKELLNEIYKSQMETFEDLKCMYDGLEFSLIINNKIRTFKSSFFNIKLSRRAMIVYLTIRRLAGEFGESSVRKNELLAELNMNEIRVNSYLDELRDAGYIILLENGTIIRLLYLGKFSDVFDELFHR